MAHLQLSLLGSPEVRYGRQTLTFATRKVLALLIYLIVEEGLHSREKLATLFWPESDAVRGRGALRTTLAHLRRTLDTAVSPNRQAYLVVEGDAFGFNTHTDYELDLHTIAAALAAETSELLQENIRLYRGDFLEGFTLPDAPAFENWAAFQREHWHHQVSIAFDRLCQWQSARRDFEGGIFTAVRWLAHDPLHEAAHRRLMQCHFLAGNRPAALQAYNACQTLLATELAAKPSPETETLLKQIQSMKQSNRFALGQVERTVAKDRSLQPLSLADMPFIGRMTEHWQLVTAYNAVCQGQTQVVLIEGEAGIGKTRLATEFLGWTAVHGADVLSGRAFEAGGRLPYQPLIDALRQRVEQENAPDDLLSDVWLTELSRLLPELRDRYPDLPSPPIENDQVARTRLLEAITRLGQALSARAPVVLFMDDLQWADTASLDALHYSGRGWSESNTPLLLLLTLRSEALAINPALGDWLSGLGRDVPLTRLSLAPITAVETQQLVTSLLGSRQAGEPEGEPFTPAWFAHWLFDETAGQPFYITEMIKTLIEHQFLQLQLTESGGWTIDWQTKEQSVVPPSRLIPSGVRELILTRLRRLTPNATALLTAAAVMGHGCSFEQLCQVADIPTGAALPALDECVAAHLLAEKDHLTQPYTLAHDKIRDVAYTEAGAARRGLYHQRALTSLEALAAPPAELAYHALAARLTKPALHYSMAAADAAMALFAVADALTHYEQARHQLSLTSDQLSVREDLQHLYLQLGRAYELMSDYQQAETVYQEMLALAQSSGQPEMACLALNRLGTLAAHTYEFETAVIWLNQAMTVAHESGNKTMLAETEWSLAQLAYHTFDYPTTVRHSQQTLTLARQLDNQELVAGSLNTLAYAEALLGQVNACQSHMAEAKDLYAALGNRALEVDCLTIIALTKMWQGETEAGIGDARTAYAISQEIDNPWGQISSSNVLAFGLMDIGYYEEALTVAQKGRQQAQAHDLVLVSFLNLLILGIVYRALMALEAAQEVHQEAADLSQRASSPAFAEMIAAQLCTDYALAGDWETATRYARQALALRQYNALPLVISPLWLETEALLHGGDVTEAHENCQRWGELVSHIPRYRLSYLHSLAVLAEWHGDREQAAEHLEAACALAEAIGLPEEQWQILAKLAQLYPDKAQQQAAKNQAIEIINHLAGQIRDEKLREEFVTAVKNKLV